MQAIFFPIPENIKTIETFPLLMGLGFAFPPLSCVEVGQVALKA
jgi:hypothetical protein